MFAYSSGITLICFSLWGAVLTATQSDTSQGIDSELAKEASQHVRDEKDCERGLTFFNKCFLVGKMSGAALLSIMCGCAVAATGYGMHTLLKQNSFALGDVLKLAVLEMGLGFTAYQALSMSIQTVKLLRKNGRERNE